MAQAARAIIIYNNHILVMHRKKYGAEYYTLVGGRANNSETLEQALVREVREETGLEVTSSRLVYVEKHPHPYNEQYTFLCEVADATAVALQDSSEEAAMNRLDMNIHTPVWAPLKAFAYLQFRTPQLHEAIVHALKKGFPKAPVEL